jgi:hypothetical protein
MTMLDRSCILRQEFRFPAEKKPLANALANGILVQHKCEEAYSTSLLHPL